MCEAIFKSLSWLHPTFKHLLATLDTRSFLLCDSGDADVTRHISCRTCVHSNMHGTGALLHSVVSLNAFRRLKRGSAATGVVLLLTTFARIILFPLLAPRRGP